MHKKILLISSRPLEHSGMTKIELDVIHYNSDRIAFDVACGFEIINEYESALKRMQTKYIQLAPKRKVFDYMKSIYLVVKQGKYDKVYIHGNSSLMVLEAFPSKLAGSTVITHCHNTRPARFSAHYDIIKPVFNCLVDYKIGCSDKASAWAYQGKRITTIRNGIDVQRFSYNPEVREQIRRLHDLQEEFVIGHIGTFNAQKNHKKLIDVFSAIIKKNKNARLLLIGDGELKPSILDYIKKKGLSNYVTALDYVNNPEAYLQAMDVLVMPSLFEGFCLVALEAQVSGLPVVVSEAIPKDAYATDRCIQVMLKESDEIWAERVLEMQKTERADLAEAVAAKGYSHDSMMTSIRNILLEK